MKNYLLFIFLAFATNYTFGQQWESLPSYKSAYVFNIYEPKDRSFMIINSPHNNMINSYITRDDGASWEKMKDPAGSPISSTIFGFSNDTLFNFKLIANIGVKVIYSTDLGVTWKAGATRRDLFAGSSGWTKTVHLVGNKVFFSGPKELVITDANLQNVVRVTPNIYPDVDDKNTIEQIIENNGALYALGKQYRSIYKSSDNGLTWQHIAFNKRFTSYLRCIKVDNGVVYAAEKNEIYELDEANSQWKKLPGEGLAGRILSMVVSGDTIMVSSPGKNLFFSTDRGNTFSVVESFNGYGQLQTESGLYWNRLGKVNNTYIAGGEYAVMRADGTDMKFKSAMVGYDISGNFPTDIVVLNGQIMLTGKANSKYKYNSANDSWIFLGMEQKYLAGGTNVTAYKAQLVRYGNTIYSTYVDLLRTNDFGNTWDTLLVGGVDIPDYTYMDMYESNGQIYLATTGSAVTSKDNGLTWTAFSPEGRTEALCVKNGELFLSNGGKIRYSTDNGATFTDIQGNLPGMVMDIKVSGNTIYAVVSHSAWIPQKEIWHSDNRNGVWVQDTMFVRGTKDGSSFDLIEFKDNIVATTEKGIYITSEGEPWEDITYNLKPSNKFLSIEAYAKEFSNDTIWAVGKDKIYFLPFKTSTTGISTVKKEADVEVYPNPAKDIVRLKTNEIIKSITLYNISGEELNHFSPSNTINLSAYKKGMYYLRIETEKGAIAKPIVLN